MAHTLLSVADAASTSQRKQLTGPGPQKLKATSGKQQDPTVHGLSDLHLVDQKVTWKKLVVDSWDNAGLQGFFHKKYPKFRKRIILW